MIKKARADENDRQPSKIASQKAKKKALEIAFQSQFWSERQGNFAALRDTHAFRLTSELVDLHAGYANLHFALQNSFKSTHQLKNQERG